MSSSSSSRVLCSGRVVTAPKLYGRWDIDDEDEDLDVDDNELIGSEAESDDDNENVDCAEEIGVQGTASGNKTAKRRKSAPASTSASSSSNALTDSNNSTWSTQYSNFTPEPWDGDADFKNRLHPSVKAGARERDGFCWLKSFITNDMINYS